MTLGRSVVRRRCRRGRAYACRGRPGRGGGRPRPAGDPAAGRADRRGALDRLRHPGLPRPGRPGAGADDLPGVRGDAGGAAALLGAQPRGVAADGARRAQRRPPRARRARPAAPHHAERRRPARGRRLAAPRRPARPGRRRGLPDLPRDVVARRPGAGARRAQPRLDRAARLGAVEPRRRRRPRRDRGLRRAGLRVRRPAQARRGLLRRERARRPGGPLLRRRRGARPRRRAAGRGVVADGHERPAVREAGGPGRYADRHREPWCDPRRRPGVVQARGGVQRLPDGAGSAVSPSAARRCARPPRPPARRSRRRSR